MKFRNAAKGLVGLLGAGAVALGVGGEVEGGIIDIWNYSPGKSCNMTVENVSDGLEGIDGKDLPFSSSPTVPSLEIYANPYGTKLKWNALPLDTLGSDFYLGV